jgi:hypothetical protein
MHTPSTSMCITMPCLSALRGEKSCLTMVRLVTDALTQGLARPVFEKYREGMGMLAVLRCLCFVSRSL